MALSSQNNRRYGDMKKVYEIDISDISSAEIDAYMEKMTTKMKTMSTMKYVKVKYDKEIDKLIDEERKLVFADFEGKRCKKLKQDETI